MDLGICDWISTRNSESGLRTSSQMPAILRLRLQLSSPCFRKVKFGSYPYWGACYSRSYSMRQRFFSNRRSEMESMYGVFIGGTAMVIFALVFFLIDRRSRKAKHH